MPMQHGLGTAPPPRADMSAFYAHKSRIFLQVVIFLLRGHVDKLYPTLHDAHKSRLLREAV